MIDDTKSFALSIGIVVGGTKRQARDWEDAVSQLGLRIMDLDQSLQSPLDLNVVFYIPGEVIGPEFEGVRTGRYSAARKMLMVQVAIPGGPLPDSAAPYLLGWVDLAILEAEAFGHRRKLFVGRLEEIRNVVEQLA